MLRDDFILGWKNIRREPFVGDSNGYSPKQSCVGTTNGAGGRNLQLFVLSADLVVLHAITGFWHPDDLAHELQLGQVAWRLYQDDSRNMAQKRRMYRNIVITDLRFQSPEMYARSDWQGFDASREGHAARTSPERDTFERHADGRIKRNADGAALLKPLNVLMHQRMAEQPFVPFDSFDIDRFVDYGTRFYDNNRGISGRGRKLK